MGNPGSNRRRYGRTGMKWGLLDVRLGKCSNLQHGALEELGNILMQPNGAHSELSRTVGRKVPIRISVWNLFRFRTIFDELILLPTGVLIDHSGIVERRF